MLIFTKVNISVWRYFDSSFITVLDICVSSWHKLSHVKIGNLRYENAPHRLHEPEQVSDLPTSGTAPLPGFCPCPQWPYPNPMHSQLVQAPLLNPPLNLRILPLCSSRPHKPEPMCASSVKRTIVTGFCALGHSPRQMLFKSISGPDATGPRAPTQEKFSHWVTDYTSHNHPHHLASSPSPELQQTLLIQTQSTPAGRTEGISPHKVYRTGQKWKWMYWYRIKLPEQDTSRDDTKINN